MNNTSKYDFTIIVPVYNERDNMQRLGGELALYISKAPMKTCVLFVNDGSTDGSGDLISETCSRYGDMFYLSFSNNCGLSAAIKAGIDQTYSPYLGYIDADLQTSPEDFDLLLEQAPDYAMVMGIRAGRKDSFIKNISSKIANCFRRKMTGDGITDTGCPLKVMKTSFAKRIPFFKGMHRFIPALIQLQPGGTVKEIPVRHFPRTAGKSKFNLANRLTGPLNDCFAYRWMKKRYINYDIDSAGI